MKSIVITLFSCFTFFSCNGNSHHKALNEASVSQLDTVNMTIEELKKAKLLRELEKDSYHSRKMVKEAQLILKTMIGEIEKYYPNLSQEQEVAILKRSTESFNALSAKGNNDIDTLAREQIIDEMERIITVFGFKTDIEVIDKWREW